MEPVPSPAIFRLDGKTIAGEGTGSTCVAALFRRINMSAARRFFVRLAPIVLFAASTAASANAPPPPGYRERATGPQLVVQPTNENVARLSIPKKLVPEAKAAEKADADTNSNGIFGGSRTVVAGAAMSAAIMLSGLYLVRRRSGRGLTSVVWIGAGLCVALAATAMADISVPGQPRRSRPTPRPPENPPGTIKVPLAIEWNNEGTEVKLSISPEQLHKNAPPAAPKAAPNAAPEAPAAK
jgi:hypothetical protein